MGQSVPVPVLAKLRTGKKPLFHKQLQLTTNQVETKKWQYGFPDFEFTIVIHTALFLM